MWFQEGIQMALNKAENEKIILLTFIKGSNEDSIKMNQILDENGFKDQLTDQLIALRFEEGSNEAKMFQEIYTVESSPTIYLIQSDAKVLDKITGYLDKAQLITRINDSLGIQTALRMSTEPAQSSTLNLKGKDKELHAQNLLKELRAKKAKEEEERQREQEKDRIRTSKELQTAKEYQQQKEMEEIIKQRKIEKKNDEIARQRVLDQIKQDQEDRKERANLAMNSAPKPLIISQPKTITSDETRIQLRLPDSSVLKEIFKIQDSLRTIVKYVEDKTEYSNFKLVLNFPKKEFGDDDLSKTLVDLKLVPSAVLMVKVPTVVDPNFGYNPDCEMKDVEEEISEKELLRRQKQTWYIKEQEQNRKENELIRKQTLDLIEGDRIDRRIRAKRIESKPSPEPLMILNSSIISSDETRIQIRLPDSSVLKDVFKTYNTLEDLFRYIELKTDYRGFSLVSQSFSKTEYGSKDLNKKLADLNLVPSAALLLKTSNRTSPICSSGSFYDYNYYNDEDEYY